MIRNVVVGQLRPGIDLAEVEPLLAAIAALEPEGVLACRYGTDLRLREESWDFAITSDFVDEAAYQAYDREPEHNRIRSEIAALSAQIVRTQFRC